MQRRPGRGTIRPVAIRDDGCARCGAELERKAVQVLTGGERWCFGCWKVFHVEYKGEPEGTAEATGERVGEGSNVPGHNHELEVDGIRIGIIGCPGCMAEERVILSSIDFTVPLYPWKGPTTEEWVRRIGGDVPWVR